MMTSPLYVARKGRGRAKVGPKVLLHQEKKKRRKKGRKPRDPNAA